MTTVVNHPLVDHRMAYMRDVATQPKRLNSHYYIVPGLGDAGNRIFGTL